MKCLLIDTAVSAGKYVIKKANKKILKHKEPTKGIGYSVPAI